MNYRSSGFSGLTPVVKNLLIINVLVFFATYVLDSSLRISLNDLLGLRFFMADRFNPIQLVTYMFLHADLTHIFFNMFAVFMFGRILEQVWGGKRFLIFYLVTGIGAGLVHMVAQYFEVQPFIKAVDACMSQPNHESLVAFLDTYGKPYSFEAQRLLKGFIDSYNSLAVSDPTSALALSREFLPQFETEYLNAHITVGASGAVFGILLAFGMLFPNVELMLLFPPIPIKAKYFVFIYGAIELFMGVKNFAFDNVAHWAHLGGMLFGFFLIRYWKNKGIY